MKAQMFDMTRMWAMVTGLAMTAWYFAAMYLGTRPTDLLAMLITAIGGFEMFLFGQDVWSRHKRKHG